MSYQSALERLKNYKSDAQKELTKLTKPPFVSFVSDFQQPKYRKNGLSTPNPSTQDLIEICQTACQGTEIDPRALCEWLIEQGDPGWLYPQAVAAWVRLIAKYGYPEMPAS